MDELKVFTGNAHPALARAVTGYLDIPLGRAEVFQFSNENIFVRILENVRQRDVFIIQPVCSPINQNLVELLIMLDAFKRASAWRITAVVPYYGYGRTDKKDQPRVPITARLVADLLTVAGANRLRTIDLHAAQIQGFFNIPADELTALNLLSDYFKGKKLSDLVVVATVFTREPAVSISSSTVSATLPSTSPMTFRVSVWSSLPPRLFSMIAWGALSLAARSRARLVMPISVATPTRTASFFPLK